MKKAKKTAFCGFSAALSVVLMLFTAVLPVLMYVLPIISGILVILCREVAGNKWAIGVYFSTSFLSLLLLTDKETALVYVLFFGYYPLLKPVFEKTSRVVCAVLKLLLFNSCAVLIGWIGVAFLGVSGEEYIEFGKFTIPILLLMANVVFILYDIMLTKYGFFVETVAKKIQKY